MDTLNSIRQNGDDIEIVNQLLLPHVVEYLPIKGIDSAHEAIKSMKVRIDITNNCIALLSTHSLDFDL